MTDKHAIRRLEEAIARTIDDYINKDSSVSWPDVLEAIGRVQDAIKRAQDLASIDATHHISPSN